MTGGTPPGGHRGLPRTILVLGGGGLKGLAHVGVWRALVERGIQPDAIVGTSIGALIGTLIAGGMAVEEMSERALELEEDDILNINRRAAWIRGIKQPALYESDHYLDYVRGILPVERFEQLARPLRMNAVSLNTGTEVWFGTGARTDISLADAVYASSALPLYFPPLPAGDDYFVDGGLMHAMGVGEAYRWGAERVIAVDVSAAFKAGSADGWLDHGFVGVHQRVMEVLAEKERRLLPRASRDGHLPLTVVRPKVAHLGTFEFGHAEYAMGEGHRAAKEALDALEPVAARAAERVVPRVRDWAQRTRRWVAGRASGSEDEE